MAQTPQDFAFYRGEDVTVTFTHSPTTESISGWTIALRVKQTLADVTAILTIAGTVTAALPGVFTVAFTSAQTLALSVGTYAYDVWRTDSGSAAALSLGKLQVTGTVRVP